MGPLDILKKNVVNHPRVPPLIPFCTLFYSLLSLARSYSQLPTPQPREILFVTWRNPVATSKIIVNIISLRFVKKSTPATYKVGFGRVRCP
jgi:hypothetical protein